MSNFDIQHLYCCMAEGLILHLITNFCRLLFFFDDLSLESVDEIEMSKHFEKWFNLDPGAVPLCLAKVSVCRAPTIEH